MNKKYLNWSSGKDACLVLHRLTQNNIRIDKLLTTINAQTQRVSMHGLPVELLRAQADALQLPLQEIALPGTVSMEEYGQLMHRQVQQLHKNGFDTAVFGDVFLEDLKAYRTAELQKGGMKAIFPLWKEDTRALVNEFIDSGYKAIVVSVNAQLIDHSLCGKELTKDWITSLPANVDACGENGEFHTFVYDGPLFQKAVNFTIGETVLKEYAPSDKGNNCHKNEEELSWDTRFWYTDLLVC